MQRLPVFINDPIASGRTDSVSVQTTNSCSSFFPCGRPQTNEAWNQVDGTRIRLIMGPTIFTWISFLQNLKSGGFQFEYWQIDLIRDASHSYRGNRRKCKIRDRTERWSRTCAVWIWQAEHGPYQCRNRSGSKLTHSWINVEFTGSWNEENSNLTFSQGSSYYSKATAAPC